MTPGRDMLDLEKSGLRIEQGLIGSRKLLLLITSRHGEARHKVLDDPGDASGFVATLRALVEECGQAERSTWGQSGWLSPLAGVACGPSYAACP